MEVAVSDIWQLANDFFLEFSRIECSLKGAGFLEGNGDREARADWGKFASEIQGKLEADADAKLTEAIKYIMENPPKMQVVRNNRLDWATVEPREKSKTHVLLVYIRRVRNNLFHGGKYNARYSNRERDDLLIEHSLCVLDGCLRSSLKLREARGNWKWP
jgi:hypothetical protein